MQQEEFKLFDTMRVILGDVPWSFLIEAVIRVTFLYVLLVVAMRLMGKRMGGQLSRNDMAAMVAMAAAVGVPMQAPDRGLMPPLCIAVIIVVGQRLIAAWTLRSKKFEQASQDDIAILLEDGCLQYSAMESSVLPKERLFAKLRSEGITHLGQVKRVYMEANGNFTILPQEPPQPGLTVLPNWDEEFLADQEKAPDTLACAHCGNVLPSKQASNQVCPHCQHQQWLPAVVG
ncbi:DUF421 domain-containing protein [Hymenobacter mucosus]|uniref:Uncharacterized membrane protein YcaP, DUF421 family n=1 Tax=Hymenobacter mucosus TaxID=1411120 RepID=A0A238Y0R5_9BACT|nr:YetF domain-containing protein [Hymenobacter mucosus]SNR64233.1 Uncharacterized membrane protein YcaP, DUF421 family [Hymenobacter mucosus]